MSHTKGFKIIESYFDENTNVTTVKINTDLGIFTGKTKLREEDKWAKSTYIGGLLAENKAMRKYYEKKSRLENVILDRFINSRQSQLYNKLTLEETEAIDWYIDKNIHNILNSIAQYDHIICELEDGFFNIINTHFKEKEKFNQAKEKNRTKKEKVK